MKRLYLMRHGEASDETDATTDINRKLVRTGITDTKKVIGYFIAQKVMPQCILTSPATRTYETAKLLANGLKFPPEKIMCDKRIYASDPYDLMDAIAELDDSFTNVILVGHNPNIAGMAVRFLDDFSIRMVPSTAIGIEFIIDSWTDIKQAKGKKLFYIAPQSL
jgi:phosphohistidine phosphatase